MVVLEKRLFAMSPSYPRVWVEQDDEGVLHVEEAGSGLYAGGKAWHLVEPPARAGISAEQLLGAYLERRKTHCDAARQAAAAAEYASLLQATLGRTRTEFVGAAEVSCRESIREVPAE